MKHHTERKREVSSAYDLCVCAEYAYMCVRVSDGRRGGGREGGREGRREGEGEEGRRRQGERVAGREGGGERK